ncbi:unnamed protein product [Ilex paraguariensis]|uniref:UspA domain-containing protein n=1 Tax=Ilex paraguariensis TaxID=185542 RepID=A0ABC8QXT5_9AQUA
MEEENMEESPQEWQYCSQRVISPEIVEIGEDSKSMISSRDGGGIDDVYVAVGKNDLNVVKWALEHAVSPGSRIFLVHVFPPITYIPTPVGRLSRSQLSQEQVQVYVNEESNRRRSLLQKYICLCTDAKVAVDTMILESNSVAKAIVDLISVVNITNLVMGTSSSRRLRKGLGKGEFVQKNAPDFCEVTIVCDGKKVISNQQQQLTEPDPSPPSSSHRKPEINRQSERNFYCICFSPKFN